MSDESAQYRKEYADSVSNSSASFDRAVTTLSAGALGLSITFVDQIAPSDPVSPGWLALAWVSFTVALVFSLYSSLTSEYAHRALIQQIDADVPLGELKLGVLGWATHVLNVASACLVGAGAGFLAYFAYVNL